MEKKTIGQFIAALRKANGLTQQQVADRLAVSNKAVSRWERDECAPDISLIPALAELLGVTCDELLKGERITSPVQAQKSEPKIEKQIKSLINRTLSAFKMLIWIAIAVSVIGCVCMFGISYGFYRPIIGFSVMLILEAASLVLALVALHRAREVKTDNELFENADMKLLEGFNQCLGRFSFIAFFMVAAVVLLSLPLVLVQTEYLHSVLTFESYASSYLWGIVLVLVCIYLMGEKPYMAWISGRNGQTNGSRQACRLNIIQILPTVLAGILFNLAPYFDTNPEALEPSPWYTVLILSGLALLLVNIAGFLVCIVKKGDNKKQLCAISIRNVLFIPAVMICSGMHSSGWIQYMGEEPVRYSYWHIEYLFRAIVWMLLVIIVFNIIERMSQKHNS